MSGNRCWLNHVVPNRADRSPDQIDGHPFVLGHLTFGFKRTIDHEGSDSQAGVSRRAPNVIEHGLKGTQRFASPVERYLTEETVLNRIVLGVPGRVMADQNGKAESVSKLALQFEFPKPEAAVVAATGIAEDQDLVLSLKPRSFWVGPPLGNGMDGEL